MRIAAATTCRCPFSKPFPNCLAGRTNDHESRWSAKHNCRAIRRYRRDREAARMLSWIPQGPKSAVNESLSLFCPMKTAAELLAVAAALAMALLNERWASPCMDALRRKGSLTDNQCTRLWGIAVIGSGALTYVLVEPVLVAWLKREAIGRLCWRSTLIDSTRRWAHRCADRNNRFGIYWRKSRKRLSSQAGRGR